MADELERILNDLSGELKGLSRVLQSTFKIFDKGNKTEAAYQKQVNDQRRKFLEVLKREGKITKETYDAEIKNTAATKKNTSSFVEATKKIDSFADAIGLATTGSFKALGKGFVDTAKQFTLADRKIEGFGDALKGFDGLSLAGVKLSDLGEAADFNVGIFKQLSQTGAGFGKSVIQLRNAAMGANMPILDFVDLISTNSTTLARLFGTIMDGMPTIQGFTKQLRERTRTELAEFGLNLEETSELLVTQLELERARGNADKIAQMDLVSRTVEYAKTLTQLSKLTGVQVKELDANNRAMAVEGAFQASLAQLNEKGRMATARATSAIEALSPEFAMVMKDITQFGVATLPVSQAFQAANPELIELTKQLNQGQITSAEFVARVKEAANVIGTDFAKAFADAGKFGLAGAEDYVNSMAKLAGQGDNTAEKQMKVQGDNTQLLVGFGETIDTLKTQAETISTKVFDQILNSAKLGEMLDTLSGAVAGMTGSTVTEKLSNALGNGFMFIKEKAGAVKEYFVKGEDNKGFADNAIDLYPEIPGIQFFKTKKNERLAQKFRGEQNMEANVAAGQAQASGLMENFQVGSDGFRDFGSGTPAMLHGIEAVVPKNDMSQLLKVISSFGNTGADPVMNKSNAPTDLTSAAIEDLNKNLTRALNTLITVSAMTEKNTKATNNNLANMSGSLV